MNITPKSLEKIMPKFRFQSLNDFARVAHAESRSKGWYEEERNIPEMLALVHSEVSEMLEAYRDGDIALRIDAKGKPEGFSAEIADAFIRLADLAHYLEIDVDAMVEMKMEYNRTRPHRHGGKKC